RTIGNHIPVDNRSVIIARAEEHVALYTRRIENRLRRLSAQRAHIGSEPSRPRFFCLAQMNVAYKHHAAFHHRFVKQPASERRRHQHRYRPRARRLAEYRYVRRIAAKISDVSLHPLERSDLVEHPVVARSAPSRFARERRKGQKSERPQP